MQVQRLRYLAGSSSYDSKSESSEEETTWESIDSRSERTPRKTSPSEMKTSESIVRISPTKSSGRSKKGADAEKSARSETVGNEKTPKTTKSKETLNTSSRR